MAAVCWRLNVHRKLVQLVVLTQLGEHLAVAMNAQKRVESRLGKDGPFVMSQIAAHLQKNGN